MNDIIWKPVVGYLGRYEVSSEGHVRSLIDTHGRRRAEPLIMKTQVRKVDGYEDILLQQNGTIKRIKVHHIVLNAFRGPAPEGCECDHINHIRTDNRLENLRWLPREINGRDQVRNGKNNFKAGDYKVIPYEFGSVETADDNPLCRIFHGMRAVSQYTGIPFKYLKNCLTISLRNGKDYAAFPRHGFIIKRVALDENVKMK